MLCGFTFHNRTFEQGISHPLIFLIKYELVVNTLDRALFPVFFIAYIK